MATSEDNMEDGMKSPNEGKSKLDSLSHEDLIKFVKRQMMQLTKAKTTNEQLMQKLKMKHEEFGALHTEKEELLVAYNAARQAQEQSTEHIKGIEGEILQLRQELSKSDQLKKKNKMLEEQIECLNMKNETMTSTFHAVQEDCDIYKSKTKELEDQISVLSEARDAVMSQMQNLKQSYTQQIQELKDDHEQQLRDTEERANENTAAEASVEELKSVINKLEQDLVAEREEKRKTVERVQNIEEERAVVVKEKEKCEGLLEQVQRGKEELNKDFDTFRHSSDSFREQMASVQDLLKDLEKDKSVLEAEKSELEEQHSTSIQLVEQLRAELEASIGDCEQLKSKNAQLQSSMEECAQEKLSSEAMHETKDSEIAKLKSKITNLSAQLENTGNSADNNTAGDTLEGDSSETSTLAELTEENEQLKASLAKYKLGADSLHEKLDQVQKINCELQTQLDIVELEKIGSDEELNKSKNTLEHAMSKLQALEEQKLKLVSRVKAAREQAMEWENMMALLKEDRDRLEADLMKHESNEQDLQRELEESNTSMQEALAERDSLQTQLYQMSESHAEDMEQQSTKHREELEQLKRDSEILNKENERQQSEIEALHSKLDESREEYQTVNEKLNKSEVELSNVKDIQDKKSTDAEDREKEIREIESGKEALLIEIAELKRNLEIESETSIKLRKELSDANGQIEGFAPERKLMEEKMMKQMNIKRELDKVIEENQSLKQTIDALGQDGEKCVADLQVRVDELNKQTQGLKDCLDEAKEENNKLKQQMKDVEDAANEKEVCFLKVKSELENRVVEISDKNEVLQSKVKELEIETEEQNSSISEHEEQMSAASLLQEKLDILNEQDKQLKAEMEKTLEVKVSLEGSVATLGCELSEQKQQNEILKTEHAAALEEKELELKTSQSLTNELRADSSETKEKLCELNSRYANLKTQHENEIEKYQKDIKLLTEQLEEIKASYAELVQTKSALEDRNTYLENELVPEITGKYTRLQQEHEKQIQDYDNRLKSVAEELEALKTEGRNSVHDATAEVETLTDKYKKLQTKHEEDIASYEMSLKKCNEELEELKIVHNKLDERCQNLTAENTVLQEQKEKTDCEKNELSEKLEDAMRSNEECEILRVKVVSLTDKLQRTKLECEQLTNKSEELLHQVTDLQEKERENVDLVNAMKQQEALIEDYKTQLEESKSEVSIKSEQIEQLMAEQKQIHEQLAQVFQEQGDANKDDITQQLKDEISVLKTELQTSEDKATKLKQLALRSKKETNETKAKLEQAVNELADQTSKTLQQAQNYASLQSDNDELQNSIEEWQQKHKQLSTEYASLTEQHTELSERYAVSEAAHKAMEDERSALQEQLKATESARSMVEQERKAEIITREQLQKDIEQLKIDFSNNEMKLKDKVSAADKELETVKQQLKDMEGQLGAAVKQTKQQSMMDLEIADYERTVETLTQTITEKEEMIQAHLQDLQHEREKGEQLKIQIETLESQHAQSEERANKLKQLLVKSKRDLSDARKQEAEQRSSDAQLKSQVEVITQICEEQKLQISSLSGDKQQLQEQVTSLIASQERSTRSADMRTKALKEDLQLAKSELETVQAEYEAYKVRVHNVLRQQKTRAAADAAMEQEKQQREHLEKLNTALKNKLAQANREMSELRTDHEMLEEEHDRLQQRHQRLITDRQEIEASWRRKLETVTLENTITNTEHMDTIQQLTQQNKLITNSYKDQLSVLQADHNHTVQLLQTQLDRSANELAKYQNNSELHHTAASTSGNSEKPAAPAAATGNSAVNTTEGKRDEDVLEVMPNPQQEERGTGEGMENTDTQSLPSPTSGAKGSNSKNTRPVSPLNLEHLLNNPVEAKVVPPVEDNDIETVKAALQTAERKVQHLSELLNESEVTIMRMTEQTKLLKEEIRRMERNQQRESTVANLEYLKNVMFKFLTLKSHAERNQLVPVLNTMLCLSGEEKQLLSAVAAGEGPDGGDKPSGWSSYIPRWPMGGGQS